MTLTRLPACLIVMEAERIGTIHSFCRWCSLVPRPFSTWGVALAG